MTTPLEHAHTLLREAATEIARLARHDAILDGEASPEIAARMATIRGHVQGGLSWVTDGQGVSAKKLSFECAVLRETLAACLRESGWDHDLIHGTSPRVFARMGDIHQWADGTFGELERLGLGEEA